MTLQGDALKDAIGRTRDKWGWFVALGVLLLIFGGIAFGNLFIATVASVYVVGWLMLMAGIIEIIHAFGILKKAAARANLACSMPSPASSHSTIRCSPRLC